MSDYYDDSQDKIIKQTINNLNKKFIELKDSVYEQLQYALKYQSDCVSSDTANLLPGLEYAIDIIDFYRKQNKGGKQC